MKTGKDIYEPLSGFPCRVDSKMIKLTFLGTGPVNGIKGKGKNKRRESSLLIETGEEKLLIDVTTDFKSQAKEIDDLCVVLITHAHKDAIGGISRLRDWMRGRKMESVFLYAEKQTIRVIRNKFKRLDHLMIRETKPNKTFRLWDMAITPIRVKHSIQKGFPTVGYLFEFGNGKSLAYVSDVGSWDGDAEKKMRSADVLVIDGAMWQKKRIAHQTIKKVLPTLCSWRNAKIIFTQIGREVPEHELANNEIKKLCPKAKLAYDGMKLTVN